MTAKSADIIDFDAAARLRLEGKLRRIIMERDALSETMRANHAAMAQVHGAVLALVDARDLDVLDQRLSGHVCRSLGADALYVFVENLEPPKHAQAIRTIDAGVICTLFDGHNERLGPPGDYAPTLYGDSAKALASEALIRLNINGQEGMLALASRDRLTFRADQGTDMASFLARVIERILGTWAPH